MGLSGKGAEEQGHGDSSFFLMYLTYNQVACPEIVAGGGNRP